MSETDYQTISTPFDYEGRQMVIDIENLNKSFAGHVENKEQEKEYLVFYEIEKSKSFV